MDPSHPDFFRRANPAAERARGFWRLGLLLPVAAALPLIFTVIRHLPEREAVPISKEPEENAVVVAEPEAELEAVAPRRMERPKSHVVVSGDTLSEIALRYGCEVSALAAANGLNPKGKLLVGTILLLPRPGEMVESPVMVSAEPKPRTPVLTPVPATWTKPAVAAERLAVQVPDAQVRSPNYPHVSLPAEEEAPPGPVIDLGGAGESGPVPGPVQPVSGLTMSAVPKATIQYLVQPGDDWERIAASHFTSAALLKRLNRIDTLIAGQVIEVPVDQCLTPVR